MGSVPVEGWGTVRKKMAATGGLGTGVGVMFWKPVPGSGCRLLPGESGGTPHQRRGVKIQAACRCGEWWLDRSIAFSTRRCISRNHHRARVLRLSLRIRQAFRTGVSSRISICCCVVISMPFKRCAGETDSVGGTNPVPGCGGPRKFRFQGGRIWIGTGFRVLRVELRASRRRAPTHWCRGGSACQFPCSSIRERGGATHYH